MLTLHGVAGSYVDALAKVTTQAQSYYGVRPFEIVDIVSEGYIAPDATYSFTAHLKGKDQNGTE